MHVTSLQEYGLRCLLQLAKGNGLVPVTVTEISEKEGLSYAYGEKLLRHLKKAGLVKSARGIHGGYTLTRDPGTMNLHEIMIALGGQDFGSDLCEKFPASRAKCIHLGNCGIRSVWSHVGRKVYSVLKDIKLTDLLGEEKQVAISMRKLEVAQNV